MPTTSKPLAAAAVILAAGASRRMGRNKMLLQVQGETLLRRAARRALDAGLAPVVVVLGYEAELARAALAGLACDTAFNRDFTGPTSSSLHRGLERLGGDTEAAVVILADMVLVSGDMLSALVARAGTTTAPLVVSRYGDVTAPPLLFRRELFGELLAWNGEGCGKAVVQRHRDQALYLDWPPAVLTDIDTPEDLRAAQALIGSETLRETETGPAA
ncbi:MAG: nucleotidyltransferase family protein [Gemmatimonadetes bacterium]|nr:nucleotidyltransferase family protein [Gemmatimonadota bacterium]